ncbi:MAG TPA: glycerophosphodiester phosphodiesterase family protein [Pyrinomonadaceae bacterium]|nr:glycerophosphodiester phosphodiesterase family protein [Pyrinomonadaceae bacterium]
MKSPLIIGHRGAAAVAPENTMAAFREAIAVGADGIEFDVRLTRDGVPVVIHDNNLFRTSGVAARVADLEWSEISKIDVGSMFAIFKDLPSGTFANERVPSLRELFELFATNDLLLCLEMKCDSVKAQAPLAEACVSLINEFGFKNRVVVECFKLPALVTVKEIDPDIQTAALFEAPFGIPSSLSDESILKHATAIGASYLALNFRLSRSRLLQKAKLANLKVAVWTVDDPTWLDYARENGIDVLITNDPKIFTDIQGSQH